jgi:hypothetical protein
MSSSADAAIPKDVSMFIAKTPSLQLLAATHVRKRNQKENYRQGYIDQILHSLPPDSSEEKPEQRTYGTVRILLSSRLHLF